MPGLPPFFAQLLPPLHILNSRVSRDRTARARVSAPQREAEMPVFSLKLQADSENIESVSTESVGRWCVVLSQGGEESGEVYIIEGAENEVPGGKGVANFVMKFKVRAKCLACAREDWDWDWDWEGVCEC